MASSVPELDLSTIYKYDHHQNIPWNIVEYQPVQQYHGRPVMISTERHITKRGFYMDPHIRYVKQMPPPDKYVRKSTFDQTENKQHSHKVKINPRLKKNSYHDEIVSQGKKTKIGVGTYYLDKKQSDKKRQLKKMKKRNHCQQGDRPSFIQDIQRNTMETPGPGNQNPHLSVDHVRKERMVPDKWVQKHKQEIKEDLKKKKKIPGPTSYRPASAGTFDRLIIDTTREKKKRGKSMNTGFGTDTKFEYERKSKKVIKQERPDSWRYDLRIKWNGKKDDVKQHGWKSFVSTRSNSMSVYH